MESAAQQQQQPPQPAPNPSQQPSDPSQFAGDDYWTGMPSIYGQNQPPAATPDQQPFGIGWDHPVFQRPPGPQIHQQPQQQSQELFAHPQQSQELFAHPQQSWQHQQTQQSNPLQQVMAHQEPQPDFAVHPQYRMSPFRQSPIQHPHHHQQQQQPQPQPQPQVQSQPPQQQQQPQPQPQHQQSQSHTQPQQQSLFETTPYNPYQFDPHHYYSNSPLPQAQSGFIQHPQQPAAPQVSRSQTLASSPQLESHGSHSYGHQTLQPAIPPNTVRYPPSFDDQQPRASYHHTINPQFLTASQMIPPSQSPQNVMVVNPAELERTPYSYGSVASQPPNMAPQYLLSEQQQSMAARPFQNGFAIVPKPAKAAAPRKKKDPAAKAAKAEAKKIAKAAPKTGSAAARPGESSSSSDYSDSSDDEPAEQSPLPPQRPQETEAATRYDAISAAWSPRNKQPTASEVRNSMNVFSELVKTIRDTWKSRSEALKAAENQNQEDKIPSIKREVVQQRRLLDVVINATLEYGHPAFVRRYGEHPMIVSALYSFLLDRHTAADSEGPLTVNILKLMKKFTTMDTAMLEKTKNDKILTRFVRKGGDTIKQLAKSILDNAAASTKAKREKQEKPERQDSKEHSAPPTKPTPTVQVVISNGPSVTGIKRPREADGSDQPVMKRTVTPANGKTTATKPAAAVAKKAVGQNGASAQAQVKQEAKPKANIVTPKPTTSLFNTLMSASKKPGTSNAARAAAAAAKENARSEVKSPPRAPVGRPAFSFSETMADLGKPKEPSPSKSVEERPPETEEERQKRLRKEERRKLRVSWKPDDSLTEIRLFTHDPDEEIGHDSSMMRDVGDVAGEGRMLKYQLHRKFDEDDDEEAREETFFPYVAPCLIDMEPLGEERERNFIKTGGEKEPASPEKVAQEQREANTLSVFHLSPADVPFSPKEPPPPPADEPYNPEAPFGEPEGLAKARSDRYFAARAPPPPKQHQPPQQPAQVLPTAPVGGVDISALLKILQGNQQPQQQQSQPAQPNVSDLERTFNQFRNPQAPLGIPTAVQPGQPAATPGLDLQKILAAMAGGQQIPQPAFQAPAPAAAPNLAAILSQFGNPAAAATPSSQSQPFGGHSGHSQGVHTQGHGGHGHIHQQRQQYHDDHGRKRGYGGGAGYDSADDDRHQSYNNKRFRINGDPNKPKRHPKAGLVPCRYWKEGKCIKGDDCTFRHDPLD